VQSNNRPIKLKELSLLEEKFSTNLSALLTNAIDAEKSKALFTSQTLLPVLEHAGHANPLGPIFKTKCNQSTETIKGLLFSSLLLMWMQAEFQEPNKSF
jgi:hypothetical protein